VAGLLDDEDADVRFEALELLRRLNAAAVKEQMQLVEARLVDKDAGVRHRASVLLKVWADESLPHKPRQLADLVLAEHGLSVVHALSTRRLAATMDP